MKKRVPSFDTYRINETIEWDPDYGRPTKVSKEIAAMVIEAFPINITSKIDSFGSSGGWTRSMASPPTVSNKGQSRGEIEYNVLTVIFTEPIGKAKITSLRVGLRKRTSGPGTGYLAISGSRQNNRVLIDDTPSKLQSVAIEFYTNPVEKLKELFNKEIKKYI